MITADSSMYHSKRAGKNRVTGVPLVAADLLDEITPASSPRRESPSGPAAAVVSSGRSRARPAAAERSDKSV
jgi:hypothetical protein